MIQSLPTFVKIPGAKYVAGVDSVNLADGSEVFAFCVMRVMPDGSNLIVNCGEVRNDKPAFDYYCKKISKFYNDCDILVERR
jgi:hypothetical protein